MAGLCEGGNELPGSLKASKSRKSFRVIDDDDDDDDDDDGFNGLGVSYFDCSVLLVSPLVFHELSGDLMDALEGMVNGRRVRSRRRYQMIDDIKIWGSYAETKEGRK
ncbi:hypothetical protein ANN_06121 [Periplaneta americana]|uniref:Uncharacterized protein n=1 Tax=Periplaneta americana TaxID=6978 RepID=A0ABQ8TCN9_PERAM|nr:hypothetical protein ANN_06121 [Periplaneta americana]